MSDRDELAGIIGDHHVWSGDEGCGGKDSAADAILAAGYTKARTITTAEELDALAVGSMIMDSDPDALLKTDEGWLSVHDSDGYTYPSKVLSFPATVLYEPAP